MKKYAYVTLLSSNDYLPGVLALNYSLQKTKCKYPLIVLVTHHFVSKDTLKILSKNKIQYTIVPTIVAKLAPYYRYRTTVNKLYIYMLEEYEKIMFLDADCIILQGLDFLFDYKAPIFHVGNTITKEFPRGQLWGGAFIIEPNKEIGNYFFKRIEKYGTDEEALNEYYQEKDIMAYNSLYYLIHDENAPKYWERYHLTTIESLINFVDYKYYLLMQEQPFYRDRFLPHPRKEIEEY